MTDTICLDENYSTTKLLTKEKPVVENKPEDKLETVLLLPEGENRKGEGGLRTEGYFKKSYKNKPLISIITVVFNGEKYLEQTIQSVINQTYDNVEYIIIDGGSTDGTVDIIKKYERQIDYWVSESDGGIYDAMNKGVALATGEWVNFMNAGDVFVDSSTLNKIAQELNKDFTDMLYGQHAINFGEFIRTKKAKNIDNIHNGMPFCHQAMFVKTDIHKMMPYSLQYKICADYEFICKIYNSKMNIEKSEISVAVISQGGLSDTQNLFLNQEMKTIARQQFPEKFSSVNFVMKYIKIQIRNILRKVFPRRLVKFIQQYRP